MATSPIWLNEDTVVEIKHTICSCVTLSLSHTHTHIHTPTHTHPRRYTDNTPSTRKEPEIGNKDHPLCLRTVNGSSNVFNLSPESNNRAHSTPPRYCSTVRLKALGFFHLSILLPFLHLCAIHERIYLWAKKKGVLLRKKTNCWENRKWINGWGGKGQMNNPVGPGIISVCGLWHLNDTCSQLFHSFTLYKNSISHQRLSLGASVLHRLPLTHRWVIHSSPAGKEKANSFESGNKSMLLSQPLSFHK